MKRFICLILIGAFMLLFIPAALAVYDGEILFRGYDWDSDVVSFIDQLKAEIQPYEDSPIRISNSKYLNYYSATSNGADVYDFGFNLHEFKNDEELAYDISVIANENIFVAGYPIVGVVAHAIPHAEGGIVFKEPAESRLVDCIYVFDIEKIIDRNLAYQNLRAKLISLYGEPDFIREFQDSFSRNVWLGENNTFVNLHVSYANDEIDHLQLDYGITNAAELIRQIENYTSVGDMTNIDGL